MHRKISGWNHPKMLIMFISRVGIWKLKKFLFCTSLKWKNKLVFIFVIRKRAILLLAFSTSSNWYLFNSPLLSTCQLPISPEIALSRVTQITCLFSGFFSLDFNLLTWSRDHFYLPHHLLDISIWVITRTSISRCSKWNILYSLVSGPPHSPPPTQISIHFKISHDNITLLPETWTWTGRPSMTPSSS